MPKVAFDEDLPFDDKELEPAGFQPITRQRPPKRPRFADREREDTRRPQREEKK